MNKTHLMHVNPDYFALLKSGGKSVEFRVNDLKRQKILAGDKINFIRQNKPNFNIILPVSKVIKSDSFNSLLKEIPPAMLGGISIQQQLTDLRNLYDADFENKHGVIAIVLET